ncbi:MAG: beta-N-acetylhexosaminidase [Beijerinckiaceae bacterium]|nr:beta-N-acetylhexosaminidase [Beijerinckiaceae bacterium]
MASRAFIAGLSGLVLTDEERSFFRASDPWGFILFRRNVDTPEQVRALTDSLRDLTGRTDLPILVDQEGGRVQRLGPPNWPKYPAAKIFVQARGNDPETARELVRLGARLMAHDLRAVGINVDCVPVLDVPAPGSHGIIGDRAYGDDPDTIATLGRAAAEGLMAGGVLPVIKHIPGHGRARVDSHEELPVVDARRKELERDFAPFAVNADMPLGMTAHVVFTALDKDNPATWSKKVIGQTIRKTIGFGGLLMTDDLSMKALGGDFRSRAEKAIAAGCDMLLHCNGSLPEMEAVAAGAPLLGGKARKRADAALMRLGHRPEPFNPVDARARFTAILGAHLAG